MRFQDLQEVLRRGPFDPFRVHLSNGLSYVIRHPEFASLTRTALYVGVPSNGDDVPDRMVQCDILHIVAIEPIGGTTGSASHG